MRLSAILVLLEAVFQAERFAEKLAVTFRITFSLANCTRQPTLLTRDVTVGFLTTSTIELIVC